MIILPEINAAALIREEFERQQSLVAVFRLIGLNNVKKAADFAFANKKIDEQKCFNNILFVTAIIHEIIKDMNFQRLMAFVRTKNWEELQFTQDRLLLQQLQKSLIENDYFLQQLANEKNQLIKNQLLQSQVSNADEKVIKMILESEDRILQLNSAFAVNVTKNKNTFSEILNNIGYNREAIDFNIANTSIHFESNEITNNLNTKMGKRFEDGSLTKENFFYEAKIAYREVIEDKIKDSGLGVKDNKDHIDRIVNEGFRDIENDMKADEKMATMYQGLDKQENILTKIESEELYKSTLDEVHEDLQSQLTSDEFNFEAAQQILQSSLDKVAVIEFMNDFNSEQDEELSFGDDPENVEEAEIEDDAENQNDNRSDDNNFQPDAPQDNQPSNEQQPKAKLVSSDPLQINRSESTAAIAQRSTPVEEKVKPKDSTFRMKEMLEQAAKKDKNKTLSTQPNLNSNKSDVEAKEPTPPPAEPSTPAKSIEPSLPPKADDNKPDAEEPEDRSSFRPGRR